MRKTRCASCLLPTEMDAELPHPRCSHLGIGNSCLAAGLQFTGLGSPQSRPIAACFVRSSGRVSPPHHISSDIVGACVLQHAPGQIMRQKTRSTLFDHSWFWPPVNTEQSKDQFSDPTTYFYVFISIPYICHFFKRAKFLENKIYIKKTTKYTVNCQFFALLRQNTQ